MVTHSDGMTLAQLTRAGHNDIMSYAPVAQAVMRSFDLVGTGKARS